MTKYENEMRLFDPKLGQRLYVDAQERERFLEVASKLENRQHFQEELPIPPGNHL